TIHTTATLSSCPAVCIVDIQLRKLVTPSSVVGQSTVPSPENTFPYNPELLTGSTSPFVTVTAVKAIIQASSALTTKSQSPLTWHLRSPMSSPSGTTCKPTVSSATCSLTVNDLSKLQS